MIFVNVQLQIPRDQAARSAFLKSFSDKIKAVAEDKNLTSLQKIDKISSIYRGAFDEIGLSAYFKAQKPLGGAASLDDRRAALKDEMAALKDLQSPEMSKLREDILREYTKAMEAVKEQAGCNSPEVREYMRNVSKFASNVLGQDKHY